MLVVFFVPALSESQVVDCILAFSFLSSGGGGLLTPAGPTGDKYNYY